MKKKQHKINFQYTLAEFLGRRGLTQQKAAALFGISQATLSAMINKRRVFVNESPELELIEIKTLRKI